MKDTSKMLFIAEEVLRKWKKPFLKILLPGLSPLFDWEADKEWEQPQAVPLHVRCPITIRYVTQQNCLGKNGGWHNILILSVISVSKSPVAVLKLSVTNISRTELLKIGNFQNERFWKILRNGHYLYVLE